MAYEKQTWTNDSAPYLDAANLNRMEVGIDGALPKSGGTMTGSLKLSGNPLLPLEAATKQYVDGAVMYIKQAVSNSDVDGGDRKTEKYIGKIPLDDFSFNKYLILVFQEISYAPDGCSLVSVSGAGTIATLYYVNGTTYNKIRITNDGKIYAAVGSVTGTTNMELLILPVSRQSLSAN